MLPEQSRHLKQRRKISMYLNSESLIPDFRVTSRELSTRAARMHAFNEAIREQHQQRKVNRRSRRQVSSLANRLA
jgi:hypothetical protein